MNLETELCRRLKAMLTGLLPGVEVFGNWLPDEDAKALEPHESARLDITVGGRRYEGYSSHVVETTVDLDLAYAFAADPTLGATIAAHETLAARLTEWQGSLAAVKRDLTVEGYAPVGLKVDDAGTLAFDRETKTRSLTHQFTIKGRIG